MTIYLARQLLAGSCERPVHDSNESIVLLLLHRRGFTTALCRHNGRNAADCWSPSRKALGTQPHHFTFHVLSTLRRDESRLYGTGIVSVATLRARLRVVPYGTLSLGLSFDSIELGSISFRIMSRSPLATLLVAVRCRNAGVRTFLSP